MLDSQAHSWNNSHPSTWTSARCVGLGSWKLSLLGLILLSATDLLCVITGKSFNLRWPQLGYLLQKGVVMLNYCQVFRNPWWEKSVFYSEISLTSLAFLSHLGGARRYYFSNLNNVSSIFHLYIHPLSQLHVKMPSCLKSWKYFYKLDSHGKHSSLAISKQGAQPAININL